MRESEHSQKKQNMRCEVFKITSDDWYPSYKLEDKTKLVRVSFMQILLSSSWRLTSPRLVVKSISTRRKKMSGGHFHYAQYKIGQIADEIEHLIETNDNDELNDWGDPVGRGYQPEVIERFKLAVATLRKAEVMAQRVDWLVSDDDGEKSFLRRWDEDLNKLDILPNYANLQDDTEN